MSITQVDDGPEFHNTAMNILLSDFARLQANKVKLEAELLIVKQRAVALEAKLEKAKNDG